MQEGVAVGRSFAILKNYQIDGNKEMVAFGIMNIVGSLTSCYITAGTLLLYNILKTLEFLSLKNCPLITYKSVRFWDLIINIYDDIEPN